MNPVQSSRGALYIIILALSLQLIGFAPAVQAADQSLGSSQDGRRDFRNEKKIMPSAESSGNMQSDNSRLPGGGTMDPNSQFDMQSLRKQGGEMPQSANPQDSTRGGGGGPSAPPGSSNPGMNGAGTGTGSR